MPGQDQGGRRSGVTSAELCMSIASVSQMRYVSRDRSNEDRMPKSAMIRARMEPGLKDRAEAMLEQIGLSATTAITLFYRQIIQRNGLPFDLRIPNAATQRAMHDARTGRGVTKAESMDDLFAKLDSGPAKKPARVAKRRTRSAR